MSKSTIDRAALTEEMLSRWRDNDMVGFNRLEIDGWEEDDLLNEAENLGIDISEYRVFFATGDVCVDKTRWLLKKPTNIKELKAELRARDRRIAELERKFVTWSYLVEVYCDQRDKTVHVSINGISEDDVPRLHKWWYHGEYGWNLQAYALQRAKTQLFEIAEAKHAEACCSDCDPYSNSHRRHVKSNGCSPKGQDILESVSSF